MKNYISHLTKYLYKLVIFGLIYAISSMSINTIRASDSFVDLLLDQGQTQSQAGLQLCSGLVSSESKQHRDILIFLDNDSEAPGEQCAVTAQFACALYQKVCPIIVSKSLWHNFLARRKKPGHNPDEDCFCGPFLVKEWNFYDINTSLMLVIPQEYQVRVNKELSQVVGVNGFTQAEQALGLKINKLKHITNPVGLPKVPLNSTHNIKKALDTVFIKNKEIINERSWNIFIMGHGLNNVEGNDVIADISIPEFRQCLSFFNTEITTNSLCYKTCYGGGSHLVDAYKTSGSPDIYNYTIISCCLTDSICFGYLPQVFIKTRSVTDTALSASGSQKTKKNNNKKTKKTEKGLAFSPSMDFVRYFDHVHSSGEDAVKKVHDMTQVINFLDSFINIQSIHDVANIPLIRAKNTTKFVPVKINGMQHITQDIAAKKIVIDAYTKLVLLEAPDIMAPIVVTFSMKVPTFGEYLSADYMPMIVSMIPGNSLHCCVLLEAPSIPMNQLLRGFGVLPHHCFEKLFFFKKIVCKKGSAYDTLGTISGSTVTFNNVVICSRYEKTIAFPGTPIAFEKDEGKSFVELYVQSHSQKSVLDQSPIVYTNKDKQVWKMPTQELVTHYKNFEKKLIKL